ncbi:MAG TPA: ABC transporter permease subunit [Anaerolineaceae bacterium]|nr:ABC transporter permease subunit [Anaerolineaceae bacterium]HOA21474.1 ABC transporter permease subunit [Anaerolineaceae bacterium]HOG77200.1 ABC transporter permease subunit [Anaerolineaceae bacterium]
MSANIFLHEIRAQRRSVITWSVALLSVIFVFFSLFTSFTKDAALMNEVLARFPEELRAAFGLGNMDLATIEGYFAFSFVFCQLLLAIQAANYGFSLLSVDETELRADFLLSKPVSRGSILSSKLAAALLSLVVTNLALILGTFTAIALFSGATPYNPKSILLVLLSGFFFQIVFLGVGLLISLLARKIHSVTPYALGLAFGAYVLNAFSGVFGDVKLELLTPFKHFDPGFIVRNQAFDAPFLLVDLIVVIVCIGLSYWFYQRRDIPAV